MKSAKNMILLKCMVMCNSRIKHGIHYCIQHLLMIPDGGHHLILTIYVLHNFFYLFFWEEKAPMLNWEHTIGWVVVRCTCTLCWCYQMVKAISILFVSIWVLVMTQRERWICRCLKTCTVEVSTRVTCTKIHIHSIHCQLDSLNFQMTAGNLHGIHRFIFG